MPYQNVFILVEGISDYLFFDRIIKPLFKKKDESIKLQIWQYQQKLKRKKRAFLSKIISQSETYIFTADLDENPCVTIKKNKVLQEYNGIELSNDNIFIVVKQIEGWYLAGLDNASCDELGISKQFDSNTILKSQYKDLVPEKYKNSLRDFRLELLRHFNIDVAKENNYSFKYFVEKYIEGDYLQNN